jgi:hypothetical protein
MRDTQNCKDYTKSTLERCTKQCITQKKD